MIGSDIVGATYFASRRDASIAVAVRDATSRAPVQIVLSGTEKDNVAVGFIHKEFILDVSNFVYLDI